MGDEENNFNCIPHIKSEIEKGILIHVHMFMVILILFTIIRNVNPFYIFV